MSTLKLNNENYEYRYDCNSFYFNSIVILGYLAGSGMLYSGIQMSKWISSLSIDGL
jgi:hypothetical protein